MRVLVDYRPALRNPTGVGEYTRQLVSALATDHAHGGLDLTLFSSSWKDRLQPPAALEHVEAVDLRVPVAVLNLAWHRLRWPPIEWLTRRSFDVAHSFHPLLMPSRSAAQIITIYDLNFLTHPERTHAEIKRDYADLVQSHAEQADHVIVISEFTSCEVQERLKVSADRITICSPGAPDWAARPSEPAHGYVLFVGTLEPRKNVGALLDAYQALVVSGTAALPPLVLAGRATTASAEWLARIERPPLLGHVRALGYVEPSARQAIYEGALFLVQPSHEEGFGMPVLEAMTTGVPVVAARRGALPEALGDAGLLVDPDRAPGDSGSLARAMRQMIADPLLRKTAASRGIARARSFQWTVAAGRLREAYDRALHRRRLRT